MKAALVLLAAAACSSPARPSVAVERPPTATPDPETMLAALPPAKPLDTPSFTSVTVCVRCHQANDHDFRDSHGRDVSPVTEAQATMMGLAARDPYFLAAVRREIAARPEARAEIEALCLRCHAPVGFAVASSLTLDQLVRGTEPAAILGRDGVGCAGCHALDPATLGKEESFTGGAPLRTDRVMYGAAPAPLEDAMLQMSKTRPVQSAHVEDSRLCASCHSVIVHGVPEQTTYLEWLNSELQRTTTCQDCHMPQGEDELDRNARPIRTAFSTRPLDAPPRPNFRRHTLRGGNAYLLRQLADNATWLNAPATSAQLAASADATSRFLTSAARLGAVSVGRELRVTVENLTGHKLPTGYPTRRMWLHVRAQDAAGRVVFESGGTVAGAIVGANGVRLDGPGAIIPHADQVSSPDEVAIWEAVPVDAAGARTHLLLATAKFAKDDRILPAGWRDDHAEIARMRPIGVDGDSDFLPGRDSVMYVLPATAISATVELLYQAIPPETIESYQPTDSLEAARFLAVASAPPVPSVIASVSVALQPAP